MNERAALACDGVFNGRMAVSQCVYADAAEQVEIALARFVDDMHAFTLNKEDGIPVVCGKQQPGFGSANLVKFGQFNLSSGHHHFGALGYARAAQVGQGRGSFCRQNSHPLYTVQ